jgi:hypothetical protein
MNSISMIFEFRPVRIRQISIKCTKFVNLPISSTGVQRRALARGLGGPRARQLRGGPVHERKREVTAVDLPVLF